MEIKISSFLRVILCFFVILPALSSDSAVRNIPRSDYIVIYDRLSDELVPLPSSLNPQTSSLKPQALSLFYPSGWEDDTRVTNSMTESFVGDMVITYQGIHIVYIEKSGLNQKVYHQKSENFGITWSFPYLIGSGPSSYQPKITANAQGYHIVWVDEKAGNPEIYYRVSNNNGNLSELLDFSNEWESIVSWLTFV